MVKKFKQQEQHKAKHPVLCRGQKQKLRAQSVVSRYPDDAKWLDENSMLTLHLSDALVAKRLDEWIKYDVLAPGTTCIITVYDDGCQGEEPCPGHPKEVILGGTERPAFLTRNWLRGHPGHIYIKVEADDLLVYDRWHGGQGAYLGGKR